MPKELICLKVKDQACIVLIIVKVNEQGSLSGSQAKENFIDNILYYRSNLCAALEMCGLVSKPMLSRY